MMSVNITVNGRLIGRATCKRIAEPGRDGKARYRTDSGEIVRHDPNDGAEALAKKLIDTMELASG